MKQPWGGSAEGVIRRPAGEGGIRFAIPPYKLLIPMEGCVGA